MAAHKSKPFTTARDVELTKAIAGRVIERADALCPGHRLRVYPTGTKVWIARLRAADRTTRLLVIGDVKTMTLEDARGAVRQLRQERKQVGDPIAARRQQRRAAATALRAAEAQAAAEQLTVRKVCEQFLAAVEGRLRPSTVALYRSLLVRNIYPKLGTVPAAKLGSAEVRSVLKEVAKRGAVTATRTRAALSSAFSWAIDEELVESNPVKSVRPASGVTRRTRTLTVEEVKTLVRGMPAGMPDDIARAVQIILRTGQRPGEVLGMTWQEIEDDLWTIPAARYKTGVAHPVPLVPQVVALLGERDALGGPVFPRARRDGVTAPLRGDTAVKAFTEALRILKIAPAVLHDLRRTFESRCVDTLKLDGDLIHHDATGHARPGVRATYQQLERLDDVREALEAWNDWLDALAVENVVVLPQRQGGAA